MFDSGLNNEFEETHDKGLRRGFDLGWSYKGRFDRQIIEDMISELEVKVEKANTPKQASNLKMQIWSLKQALKRLKKHPNNRENITLNSW